MTEFSQGDFRSQPPRLGGVYCKSTPRIWDVFIPKWANYVDPQCLFEFNFFHGPGPRSLDQEFASAFGTCLNPTQTRGMMSLNLCFSQVNFLPLLANKGSSVVPFCRAIEGVSGLGGWRIAGILRPLAVMVAHLNYLGALAPAGVWIPLQLWWPIWTFLRPSPCRGLATRAAKVAHGPP